jgi:hypothetical protein
LLLFLCWLICCFLLIFLFVSWSNNDWLFNWPIYWLADWLVGCLVGLLADFLVRHFLTAPSKCSYIVACFCEWQTGSNVKHGLHLMKITISEMLWKALHTPEIQINLFITVQSCLYFILMSKLCPSSALRFHWLV